MVKLTLTILVVVFLNGCGTLYKMDILQKDHKQLLVVIAETENSTKGKLFLFEKKDKEWNLWKSAIPVCLGRNGLGWGMTDPEKPGGRSMPLKMEGDGKSPAGYFSITRIFGFDADKIPSRWSMPYLQINEMTECIDDINSFYYNQIVSRAEKDMEGNCDWKSCEKMWTLQRYYNLGAVVDYNQSPAIHGKGSCIFLHIWSGPDGTTAGCTSMSAENMEVVAQWMDSSLGPILVQLTSSQYLKYRKKWELPEISMK